MTEWIWIVVLFALVAVFIWSLCKAGETPGQKIEDDDEEAEFIHQWKHNKERRKKRK